MKIKVEVVVKSATAYNEQGLSLGLKMPNETVEQFNQRILENYPDAKINVVTSLDLPMVDGEVIDAESGEVIKVKRNVLQKALDNYTRSLVSRELSLEEYIMLRRESAILFSASFVSGVTFGIVFGKTFATGALIALCSHLLLDVSTFKLRKNYFRRKLGAQ